MTETNEAGKALPSLYPAHLHRAQLRMDVDGDDDAAWMDLDVRSDIGDARSALLAYLREEFGDPNNISESKDGVFTVLDDSFGEPVKRQYRIR